MTSKDKPVEKTNVSRRKFIIAGAGIAAAAAVGGAAYYLSQPGPTPTETTTQAGTSTTTIAPTSSAQPVELYWLTREYNEWKATPLSQEYMGLHPNVKIRVETQTWTGLYEKLTALFAGGGAPDCSEGPSMRWLTSFVNAGWLEPLDDYFNRDFTSAEQADFWPLALAASKRNGKLMCLPNRFDGYVPYWNPAIFEEIGADPTKGPDSWDDFLEVAKNCVKDDPATGKRLRYGVAMIGSPEDEILNYWVKSKIWGDGLDFVSEDLQTTRLTEPEFLDDIQWLVDLNLKHKVVAPDMPATQWSQVGPTFANGVIAMFFGVSVQQWGMVQKTKPEFKDNPMKVGIAPPFRGKVARKTGLSGNFNGIPTSARQAGRFDEAWEFNKWLFKDPNKIGNLTTANPATYSAQALDKYKIFRDDPMLKSGLDCWQYVWGEAPIYKLTPYIDIVVGIGKAFVQCWQGGNVRDVMTRTKKDLDAVLKAKQPPVKT